MSEVKKQIKYCPNGHPYDPARHTSCPYCEGGNFAPTLDPFVQGNANNNARMDATIDPGYPKRNYESDFNNARPLDGQTFDATRPPEVMYSNKMSETISIDHSTPAGAPSPVVGWLVALNGPCRGTDYRIHVGYNYIGRTNGDIRIQADPTISSERDSCVTYVPQIRKFAIAHLLGKNPLLVNNQVVMLQAELNNYDRITIGSTNFIFVALSGEHFDWSEG